MGVQTLITLRDVRLLFPHYKFQTLQATTDGVMDTTYILDNYILKKYERNIKAKIIEEEKLLYMLHSASLNVPQLIHAKDGWYLYERLRGKVPTRTDYYHIQALARFISRMHQQTYKLNISQNFLDAYNLKNILNFTKQNFYFYFKKLQNIQNYRAKNEGFIHGDIFRDNTIFDGEKIGVFDFIDGGTGEFSFDIAVVLISFNPKNKLSFIKLFLNTYNQNAPEKISLPQLKKSIKIASGLYALLRIEKYKNPQKAKILANLW